MALNSLLTAVLKGHKTDSVFQFQLFPSTLLNSNQVIGPFPLETDQYVLSFILNIAVLFLVLLVFPLFFFFFHFTPLKVNLVQQKGARSTSLENDVPGLLFIRREQPVFIHSMLAVQANFCTTPPVCLNLDLWERGYS